VDNDGKPMVMAGNHLVGNHRRDVLQIIVEDNLFLENDIDVFLEENRKIGNNVFGPYYFSGRLYLRNIKGLRKCNSNHSTKWG